MLSCSIFDLTSGQKVKFVTYTLNFLSQPRRFRKLFGSFALRAEQAVNTLRVGIFTNCNQLASINRKFLSIVGFTIFFSDYVIVDISLDVFGFAVNYRRCVKRVHHFTLSRSNSAACAFIP